ncbi:GNAT family N-acetyltransferase [Microbulbifer yueqingensis]|uniref:Acetyltransferase (GNAT) family protein n=1 Tax=Microbulbifer yueqingensis TaxID=658219 RepID=A0A1G8W1A6_9GAMM|nr:GNAT family N-acetyltransferase [Microbulbifer yueqingensis]SDJ71515.1 Acetyltransferase (GNAT) family protein [Microbulbifer yueqingensis]
MIQLIENDDLISAANLALCNMKSYYHKYSVDWGVEVIVESTQNLENFDLCADGVLVGIMRLTFEGGRCQLRDLQIKPEIQSNGYGSKAIAEAKRIAMEKGLAAIDLKVFKCSPARNLYFRLGFTIDAEDDRFYYMSLDIS